MISISLIFYFKLNFNPTQNRDCYCRFPGTELATQVEAIFDAQFTAEKVAMELQLFEQEYNYSFERTYGWAWFLKLMQVRKEMDESGTFLNQYLSLSEEMFGTNLIWTNVADTKFCGLYNIYLCLQKKPWLSALQTTG